MFRLGLDISALSPDFKEHAQRGIGRYVYELKKYFDAHPTPGLDIKQFRVEDFSAPPFIDTLVSKLPFGKQTIRQQLVYPLGVASQAKKQFDLIHFPAHMDAPSWSLRDFIITVLDLIPFVCADLYKASATRYHIARKLESRAIKNASHVITISHHSAKDIEDILGIPKEKISVTYLGVDNSFFEPIESLSLREKLQISHTQRIVSYVGGIDPRKNIEFLVDAFAEVVRSIQSEPPVLVIAGSIEQDREYEKFKKAVARLGIEQHVRETGYLAEDDLRRLYRESAVFFFPSLYEGFGLPPLEALASGCPVVSSNTSSLPEVLGGAAVYVDPKNKTECVQGLLSVLEDTNLRERLNGEGPKQARKFQWERTGRETLAVYERVLATM